ncbi:DUF654-domain-containing protein [Piromyces finnis]|uniref:DUF654-domain-containing protein n=1 Tax=Piromyces finnis TaxID=1754191 RepID=A0A1Y1V9I6_9FUNG|nr:DUF654-domain-containing protein [Piromyces finnis]|eukprot:ORX50360.1 DUF654-domain-containing protein [Piromyces finnis]
MSLRSVRKILKQRGELDNLSSSNLHLDGSDSEEEEPIYYEKTESKQNIFDLLNVGDDDEEEEPQEEPEEEEEEKPVVEKEVYVSSPPSNNRKSKKKKGKKGKGKKGKGKSNNTSIRNSEDENGESNQDEEFEDIDKTIQEINEKFGKLTPNKENSKPKLNNEEIKLFTCQYKMFDETYETSKIFGSRIANEDRRKNKRSYKRNGLVIPKENWPMFDRIGLDMELTETKDDGTMVFKFTHSMKYQEIQRMFLDCVASYNPNNIAELLRRYPYHVDSLIQLSEVFKHSGDIPMAANFIERAVYTFDRSMHPRFNVTTNLCRLEYKYIENRSFFIALFKHIQYLGRKGCWRTAFEFCKLLLGLDHKEDALGALLFIDYYALMSKEYQWLIDFYEYFKESKGLSLLPNFAYSIALAKWHVEHDNGQNNYPDSTNKMIQAIIFYPYIVPILYKKCGITDNTIKKHSYFQRVVGDNIESDGNTGMKLLLDLYIERAWSAWKEDEILDWLKETVKEAFILIKNKDPILEQAEHVRQTKYVKTPRNIYRHILLSDIKEVTASIPPEYTPNGGINMYDPLPPEDSVNIYDDQRSREFERNSILEAFIRSILPSSSPESSAFRRRSDNNQNINNEELNQTIAAAANAALPGVFPLPDGAESNTAWTQTIRETLMRMGLIGNAQEDEAIPDLLNESNNNSNNNNNTSDNSSNDNSSISPNNENTDQTN